MRLRLTDQGARQLEALSEQHLDELAHLAPTMHALWDALEDTRHRDLDGAPHPAAPGSGCADAAARRRERWNAESHRPMARWLSNGRGS